MQVRDALLREEERIALILRTLYQEHGYTLFRLPHFEEYHFYLEQRSFLAGDDVITFNGSDGRLLALNPDVTLSIVKNTPSGQSRQVYYHENVYRHNRRTDEYRQISQVGIEHIGSIDAAAELSVIRLAVASLAAIGQGTLEFSHSGIITAILHLFPTEVHNRVIGLITHKNIDEFKELAATYCCDSQQVSRIVELLSLSGNLIDLLPRIAVLLSGFSDTEEVIEDISRVAHALVDEAASHCVRLAFDCSTVNDTNYYSGLLFQGFIRGIPQALLFGGRYDGLFVSLGKSQQAIGFALQLDELDHPHRIYQCNQIAPLQDNAACEANNLRLLQYATGSDSSDSRVSGQTVESHRIHSDDEHNQVSIYDKRHNERGTLSTQFAHNEDWLDIALPKGRMATKVHRLLHDAGLVSANVFDDSRKLVFEDQAHALRFFLVKPADVGSYVEHGAADIGVIGRDVLLESQADVLDLARLPFGCCRIAVAGPQGLRLDMPRPLRVATKYPRITREYFASRSQPVQLIHLNGSIELAPIVGLADVIVDIVETGDTLKQNNLVVLQEVDTSSAHLIVNCSSWRFKQERISQTVQHLSRQAMLSNNN